MKIIWLEDDPKTIRNNIDLLKEKLHTKPVICECFAEFSQELELVEDSSDTVLVIDIRMLFNIEDEFSCFDKIFSVKHELDAGFEYFKSCLENRFSKVKMLFFTSKPLKEAKSDAKKYLIDTHKIVTKDDINRLIELIKGKK